MKTRAVRPESSVFGCIRAIPLRQPDPHERSAARPLRGAVLACAVLLTGLFAVGNRLAAPAGARDRARSRRPARPGRAAATVLVLGLLLLGAAAAEAQTAPTVTGVALTSAPGTDETYAFYGSLQVQPDVVEEATVTFSAAVDITGTPQLELDFAGTPKAAACATDTNTTTMVCSYTVAENDSAPNGIAIAANKLTGGTIYATGSTTVSADLDHVAVAIDANHKVDGIRPTLVTTAPDAPTTSPDGETVLLVFSEDIGAVSHSNITIQADSVNLSTTMANVAGTKVEITLTTALTTAATNLTVALAADAVDDAAGNGILAVAATPVTYAVGTTACTSSSTAVSGFLVNLTNLVTDCNTLLGLMDTLRGTKSLNWAETLPMSSWAGVTVAGTSPRVTELKLSGAVAGSIPATLGNLSGLTYLALDNAGLSGTIPDLSTLTSLEELYLHANNFTGTFPTWLGTLTNLTHLHLFGTAKKDLLGDGLSGTIPDLSTLTSLEELIIDDNGLTGMIPTWLRTLTSLTRLDLDRNRLGGEIPEELGDLSNLIRLDLANNQLTGTIPSLSNLTQLEYLGLHNNMLTGTIPSLSNLTKLEYLGLHNNMLTGAVPSLSALVSLKSFALNTNMLTGAVPDLSALTELIYLGLNDNMLTGVIPDLSALTKLTTIFLYNNKLSGEIPDLSALTSLQWLYLHNNKLSGKIPAALGTTVTGLTHIWLHRNQLSGKIPAALGNLSGLLQLVLHRNQLSGKIPAADLGRLTNLLWLTLAENPGLTGPVTALGSLTGLGLLWLQDTSWTGTIPAALLTKQTAGTLTLLTNRRPRPPTVEAQILLVGQQFEYPVDFSDPDGDTLTYHATLAGATPNDPDLPLPAWLTINRMTGSLSGTPPVGKSHMVRVIATDEDSPPNPPTEDIPFCDPAREAASGEVNPPPLCGSVIVSLFLAIMPNAPTNLTAEGGDQQVTLNWTAPASNGGDTITHYEYEVDGSGTWINTGSTATSHTVTDLNNGQTYVFRVRAVNGQGTGDPVTLEATPSRSTGRGGGSGGGGGDDGPREARPRAPTNLLLEVGDGQVTLRWDAPEGEGAAAIIDYEYRINGQGDWISTGSTDTTHTVTGLDNDTEYTFEVRAVSRNRKGRASGRVEATPRMPTPLDFTHFANGAGTTSGIVLVNVAPYPTAPALYFYDTAGNPIAPASVVEVTGDLMVAEDGALTLRTAMESLG